MKKQIVLLLVTLMLSAMVLYAQKPKVFIMNADTLMSIQSSVFKGDKRYNAAMGKLKKDAEKAVNVEIVNVMQKDILPPSGDKHDFLSLSRYWWPDSSKPDGMPYIRKDGQVNPEILKIPDHENLMTFLKTVNTLALAYFYTGNVQYSDRAALWLRTWLVDPATKMNPNMKYSQQVRGRDIERGTGILDGRDFALVIDGIGLLRMSTSLTPADNQKIDQWFKEYYTWLTESSNGQSESNAKNNHGSWYDAHTASVALFIGQKDKAKEIFEAAKQKRIAYQFSPDGSQDEELARTLSWHYSQFNLTALFRLAALAKNSGVDLFGYTTADGRSIRKGLDYLIPFANNEQQWKETQIKEFKYDMLAQLARQASIEYKDEKYYKVWMKFYEYNDQAATSVLQFGLVKF